MKKRAWLLLAAIVIFSVVAFTGCHEVPPPDLPNMERQAVQDAVKGVG